MMHISLPTRGFETNQEENCLGTGTNHHSPPRSFADLLPAHIVQAEALIMRPACRLVEEIKKIPIRNSFAVNYCL